jgi:methylated-DNA-[protein]-cysteine S-methyltransferase
MTTTAIPTPGHRHVASPVGRIRLDGHGQTVTGLYLPDHPRCPAPAPDSTLDADAFAEAQAQLDQYFAGTRRQFDLPLELHGTPFQVDVWTALRAIPYGETTTYAAIAEAIGRPAAVRAVGAANGRNPISIIVACHRVIGADGGLTGYGWGVERKAWLLEHERDPASRLFA